MGWEGKLSLGKGQGDSDRRPVSPIMPVVTALAEDARLIIILEVGINHD